MNKLKYSLTTVNKLVVLSAIALIIPISGYGQQRPLEVKVVNPSAEPVPVTGTISVGNLGTNPLTVTGTVNVGNLSGTTLVVREAARNVFLFNSEDPVPVIKVINVPQGKQLVLEWVSVVTTACVGLRVAVQTGGNALGSQYWLPDTPRLIDEDTQVLSSQIKSYSKPGSPVEILVGKSLFSAPCLARIYASGYFLDLP